MVAPRSDGALTLSWPSLCIVADSTINRLILSLCMQTTELLPKTGEHPHMQGCADNKLSPPSLTLFFVLSKLVVEALPHLPHTEFPTQLGKLVHDTFLALHVTCSVIFVTAASFASVWVAEPAQFSHLVQSHEQRR